MLLFVDLYIKQHKGLHTLSIRPFKHSACSVPSLTQFSLLSTETFDKFWFGSETGLDCLIGLSLLTWDKQRCRQRNRQSCRATKGTAAVNQFEMGLARFLSFSAMTFYSKARGRKRKLSKAVKKTHRSGKEFLLREAEDGKFFLLVVLCHVRATDIIDLTLHVTKKRMTMRPSPSCLIELKSLRTYLILDKYLVAVLSPILSCF